MCTAISFNSTDHYFGRNLDLERSYDESIVVTPRRFRFDFRKTPALEKHYAIIGMAFVEDSFPLYYEATNEKGLSAAGLNFPGYADYKPVAQGKDNIAPFEFIPWILGQCADIREVREKLVYLNLAKIDFKPELPLTPLHWIIADRNGSITVESTKEGLKICDNPVGVLTNSPPFDFHMTYLCGFMSLHEGAASNRLSPEIPLKNYSLGLGAFGLPGDFSSASRFVKATFVKLNSSTGVNERENVSHFFHILGSVSMPKGCVLVRDGEYEYTRYSSCCNTDKGIYYYTTYEDSSVRSVNMHDSPLDGAQLNIIPLK